MIFVTGDTHQRVDFQKLLTFASKNPQLTKEDYVIVAGDFGGIWNKETLSTDLKPYNKLPFTILFIDGNHENFDLLDAYPVEIWKGGKVHIISDSIIHLMRGQIFTIEDKSILTFGGATSIDKIYRHEHTSWWSQETPTQEDLDEALANLEKVGNKVDYIISHSCSERVIPLLPLMHVDIYKENRILSLLEDNVEYKYWYFGHFHSDWNINEKQTLLYQQVVKLGDKL